jgi:hypothetical protein
MVTTRRACVIGCCRCLVMNSSWTRRWVKLGLAVAGAVASGRRTRRTEFDTDGLQMIGSVVDWLLDSDPSIRWQVMRDLTATSADVVAAERSRVANEGWGARLLDEQRADGQWGTAFGRRLVVEHVHVGLPARPRRRSGE